MKLLIVDDERDIRDYLRRLLEISGFEVIEADCGESALYALAKNPDIDLVILDWMMPGMSGLDVLSQIKQEFDATPVLMLSARTSQQDIIKALEFGATDYVLKPIEKDHLLFKINSLLNLGQEVAMKRASRRKNVNFSAASALLITAFSSKGITFETSYPIPAGSPLVFASEPLAKMLDIKGDTRYVCRVLGCQQEGQKYTVNTEFVNLPPSQMQRLEAAAIKLAGDAAPAAVTETPPSPQ